jgi:hypothetical protein
VCIVPKTITAVLDGTGQLNVSLPATNDPDLSVTGWAYLVTEHLDNGGGRPPFLLEVPYTAGTLDLVSAPHAVSQTVTPKVASQLYLTDVGASVASQSAVATAQSTIDAFKSNLSSPLGTGALLVRFLQSGAGSIVQWIGDKLAQRVSVLDFMTDAQRADVLGDTGALDVTAACQAAIDAHKRVEFPAGALRISSLTIPDNRMLRFHGYATRILADDTSHTFNVTGSNVRFIDAPQFASRNGALYPAAGAFRSAGAYIRAFGNRIRVEGGYLGLGFIGIQNEGTSNTFSNVDVRDTKPSTGMCFNILGGFDVSLTGCTTDNNVSY